MVPHEESSSRGDRRVSTRRSRCYGNGRVNTSSPGAFRTVSMTVLNAEEKEHGKYTL